MNNPVSLHNFFLIFMKAELITSISFTEDDYNLRMSDETDAASFDEFIDAILMFVDESGGGLEEAVCMAEEVFSRL